MKSYVLITSGQPSLNPRIVKEANALCNAGNRVHVIYAHWNRWGTEVDVQLLSSVKWTPVLAGGQLASARHFYTRVRHRVYKMLARRLGYAKINAECIISRCSYELMEKAKSIKADLYIAHNLAALPAAVNAARYNKAKAGFDAEDFHRQEVTNDARAHEYQLAKIIEDKYLPLTRYRTAASPLIAQKYVELYPQLSFINVNNVFSLTYQSSIPVEQKSGGLKLFWFSQTIGKNRGLEQVIFAMGKLLREVNIQLTLAGECTREMYMHLKVIFEQNQISATAIQILPPMPEADLFELAAAHDIGLALEPGFCLNNNIALSNKIFSYLISGLAVIATNTAAQQEFMTKHPGIGRSFDIGDTDALVAILEYYASNSRELLTARQNAWRLANEELNWEKESRKFLAIVESVS